MTPTRDVQSIGAPRRRSLPGRVGISTQQLTSLARRLARTATEDEYHALLDWITEHWDAQIARQVADRVAEQEG